MNDEIIKKVEKLSIGEADFYYWRYQYLLGKNIIAPFLNENVCSLKGKKIAEIGSAEGGVLHSIVAAGAQYGLGTDIAENRLETGRKISAAANLNVEFTSHNILSDNLPEKWHNEFDIVILRDVIEHLDNTYIALKKIRELLRQDGYLYVTFPPYNSPFGGHQHTLAGNMLTKLPYIHLLPLSIFKIIISSGRKIDQEEVLRLKQIKLSSQKFKQSAKNVGFSIYKEEYYLLRPVFKMKFGLPTLKITPIAKYLPIRDFLSLECMYVLKK